MSETLKLQHVTLTGAESGLSVEVVYADADDLDSAFESVVMQLRLTMFEFPVLAEARLEALQRVRALLTSEIQALEVAKRGTASKIF